MAKFALKTASRKIAGVGYQFSNCPFGSQRGIEVSDRIEELGFRNSMGYNTEADDKETIHLEAEMKQLQQGWLSLQHSFCPLISTEIDSRVRQGYWYYRPYTPQDEVRVHLKKIYDGLHRSPIVYDYERGCVYHSQKQDGKIVKIWKYSANTKDLCIDFSYVCAFEQGCDCEELTMDHMAAGYWIKGQTDTEWQFSDVRKIKNALRCLVRRLKKNYPGHRN